MEKQLIPQLRFPKFSDIWEEKKLQNRCTFFSGGTPTSTKKEYYNGNIPFIGSGDIFDEKVAKFISKEALSNSSAKIVEVGDILYALYGANSGDVAVSKIKGAINQAILCIRTEEEKGFLYQLLSYRKGKIVSTFLQGGQGNLSSQIIKKLKLNFPTLPEQKKIASFLTAIDDKITKLTKKKALLEQYKKGIMQKIFNQELRFKDDNGNAFPDWEEKKLADFKGLVHGDGDWILSKDISKKGDYKIVQLGNIGFGLYVEKKLKTITSDKFTELKGTLIKKGDLLINRMVDGALNCCILKKDGNYITSVDICWIRQNDYFNNYFLMSLILFSENQNKLLNLSSGSGRVRISKKNLFNEFSFKLPSKQEQTKIANFLSDIDLKIEALNNKIENSKNFKKGLLQQMFV